MVDQQYLMLVCGISASGKTAIIQEFCRQNPGVLHLEKDTITDCFRHIKMPNFAEDKVVMDGLLNHLGSLAGTQQGNLINGSPGLIAPFDSAYYALMIKDQTFMTLQNIAKMNLSYGNPVIVDTFARNQIKDGTLDKFVSQTDKPTVIVSVEADGEIIKQRTINRIKYDRFAASRDAPKVESDLAWEKFLKTQPIHIPELDFYNHLVIYNNGSIENSIRQLKEGISYQVEHQDSLLIRVDDNGKPLGGVHYSKAHPKDRDGIRHHTVVSLVFTDHKKKDLLLQKIDGKDGGVVYDVTFGGHQTYGETPDQTMKREFLEEVLGGDASRPYDITQLGSTKKDIRKNDPEFVTLFEIAYPGPYRPADEKEVLGYDVKPLEDVVTEVKERPELYTKSSPFILEKYFMLTQL